MYRKIARKKKNARRSRGEQGGLETREGEELSTEALKEGCPIRGPSPWTKTGRKVPKKGGAAEKKES